MTSIALLMGLLVLSYVGSLLVGTGKTRGLASGVEYVGLGFAVGPHVLGLVGRPMITEFSPIVQVALGWLAFVLGLDFGRIEGRRVRAGHAVLGVACAVITGLVVAAAVFELLRLAPVPGIDLAGGLLLAGGAGAVAAETARSAVDWVAARWGAKGQTTRLLADIGAVDDLVPLVAAGAIFALAPASGLAITLPVLGWFGVSLALGALLGVVTAMLLRGAEGDAVWGALIGTILLCVGTAARFGLCTIFVTFVMGIALAAASPHRRALRKMVGPTERAVLYPMLLLAGARLDLRPILENRRLAAAVVLVLLARIAGKLLSGLVVRLAAPPGRAAGSWVGLVLLASGPVSIACGFVFALRFPGPIGDTLLVAAVGSALVGELVSTLGLKSLLTELGELVPPAPPPPPAPPSQPAAPPVPRAAPSVPPPRLTLSSEGRMRAREAGESGDPG